jgi:hypothetical protein
MPPAATIAQVAADRTVDLIVLGTHGRSGLAHLMLKHLLRPFQAARHSVGTGVSASGGTALESAW